jgi:SSS family solute:Na+ symporter
MMTILLAGVALYTILGGMLSVLVTDFLQFVVMSIGLLAVTLLILTKLGWSRLAETVESNHGPGGFNPFVNAGLGWECVVFNLMLNTAAVLTWQTQIARVLAAKDTATGRKVYTRTSFFFLCRWLIPGVWGIAALGMLGWAPLQSLTVKEREMIPAEVQAKITASSVGEPLKKLTEAELNDLPRDVQAKLTNASLNAMPSFLATFVPAGLMGILVAAMLAADMSTDSSYMLTWGGVIYNDILAPLRRKQAWSERRGLFWNRTIIALIGVFLLFYGLWYPLKGDLWAYLAVTGTIYLASIATLLVACCYWPRANNWGATAAIVVGAIVPITYLVLEQLPATKHLVAEKIGPNYSGIAAYVATGLAMVIGSLLKPQPENMNREG